MLPPYLDRLDNERQTIFKKLRYFSDRFILAEGTVLMLQIGHRLSYDFDCFSKYELPKNLLSKIRRIFGLVAKPVVNNSELCLVKLSSGIELHFVYHPFKDLQKPIRSDYLPLANKDDLAANKAYTIGRRGAWRDYVDLFFLLKWKKYSIEKLTKLAEQKFQGEFNPKLFLEQLVYFKDLDITDTVFLKESYTSKEIQSFLSDQVDYYVKKVLKFG